LLNLVQIYHTYNDRKTVLRWVPVVFRSRVVGGMKIDVNTGVTVKYEVSVGVVDMYTVVLLLDVDVTIVKLLYIVMMVVYP
jgi:hypothetical protein